MMKTVVAETPLDQDMSDYSLRSAFVKLSLPFYATVCQVKNLIRRLEFSRLGGNYQIETRGPEGEGSNLALIRASALLSISPMDKGFQLCDRCHRGTSETVIVLLNPICVMPLLDRIDINEVPHVDYDKLTYDRLGEPSEAIRTRVQAARERQEAIQYGPPRAV